MSVSLHCDVAACSVATGSGLVAFYRTDPQQVSIKRYQNGGLGRRFPPAETSRGMALDSGKHVRMEISGAGSKLTDSTVRRRIRIPSIRPLGDHRSRIRLRSRTIHARSDAHGITAHLYGLYVCNSLDALSNGLRFAVLHILPKYESADEGPVRQLSRGTTSLICTADEDLEDPIFRTVPPTPPETAMEPLVKAAAGTTQKTARPGQARMASPGATSSGAVRPVKGSVRFAPSVTAPRSAPSSALRTTQSGAMDASRTATTDTAVRTTKPGLPAAARASRPLPQGPVSVSASASGSVSASRTVAPGAIGSKTAISAPDNRTIPRSAAQRLRAPGPSAPGARSAIRAASANASSIPKQARVEGGEAGEGETDVQRMQREMDEDMCELGEMAGEGVILDLGDLVVEDAAEMTRQN